MSGLVTLIELLCVGAIAGFAVPLPKSREDAEDSQRLPELSFFAGIHVGTLVLIACCFE